MLRVTIFNENIHEKISEAVRAQYPLTIGGAIGAYLASAGNYSIRQADLDMPECGLSEEVLAATDVLLWWGHMGHHLVPDEVADRVCAQVIDGMGLIVLHSGHFSKPFRKLMGTSCSLRWRDGDWERLWNVNPTHPIAEGIPAAVEIGTEEMYGEMFDIPKPDEVVFAGWFRGGEIFRSGCCFTRGLGKIFYFQPGHETCASYHNPYVLKIIDNAVRWAAPARRGKNVIGMHDDRTTNEIVAAGETIEQF